MRNQLAISISKSHYSKPDFLTVEQALSTLKTFESLNQYLSQLDPYSQYLLPEQYTFYQKRQALKRFGIGINILFDDNAQIVIPLPNTPIYQAGLTHPHYLQAINGQPLIVDNFDSYRFLTENQQTPFTLTVKSPNTDLTTQYTAHPKLINNPSVQLIDGRWPLIRIYRFDEQDNTAKKLKNMIKKLQKQRKPVIIDLRYCPGGSFYAAVDALNWFLPKNLAVTHLKTAKSNSLVTFQTLSGQIIKQQPIYLWVSPYTASAAEVFVRALQFYATNVTVIGTQTAGKCLSQQIMPLKDNSALVLSVYKILTPSEKSCQGQGIQPTISILPTDVLNDEAYKKYLTE